MKKIPLGTTDITLSRMGLGTWAIGGGPAWNGDLDRQIYRRSGVKKTAP